MSNALLDNLKDLSQSELRELRARASALIGSDSSVDETKESMVHDAIETVLRSIGHSSVPPLKLIRQQTWGKDFRAGVVEMLQFVEDQVKPSGKLERIKVVRIFVRMIVRQLAEWQVPMSYKVVAQNLKKVAEIVDLQFPGYQACGLLGMIVKKEAAN